MQTELITSLYYIKVIGISVEYQKILLMIYQWKCWKNLDS